jgi:hypothetical protein
MMEGMKGMGPTPQQLEEAKKQGLSVEGAPGAEPAAEGAKDEAAAEPAKEAAAAEPAAEEKKAE